MSVTTTLEESKEIERREAPRPEGQSPSEAFHEIAIPIMFGPRQVIVRQGEPANRVFVVERGRLKSVIRSAEGTNAALEILGPGQMFGEAALLAGDTHYATTVVGMNEGELRSIDRPAFLAWLGRYPAESRQLLMGMSRRIAGLSQRVETSTLALPRRLARVLLLLVAELGTPAEPDAFNDPLNVSQQELGEFAGATRESVNRQLCAWEREGVVALRRGRVVVTNPNVLRNLSDKA
jgi:CRP/FNR family cyclic AMP-dependent transcriptional regulator